MERFGKCGKCGTQLFPVWFEEKEHKTQDGIMWYTGRKRRACSHLECPTCFKNYIVDDSFDGPWR